MAERPSRIRPGIALSFVLWIYGFLLLIPLPPTAWDRVKRYRGVDLGHADSASLRAFEQELLRALPDLAEGRPLNAAFVALLKVEEPGREVRYVVVDNHIGPDPTGSTLQFTIVGERGGLISRTLLWMGWRTHFGSVEVVRYPDTRVPVFRIRTPDKSSIEPLTQYYGFRGDGITRLREETVEGFLSRYLRSDAGFACVRWTESEWESWTRATDPVEILEALAWLSGSHRERPPVAGREPIRKRLKELSTWPDPWIRQAATAALSPQ